MVRKVSFYPVFNIAMLIFGVYVFYTTGKIESAVFPLIMGALGLLGVIKPKSLAPWEKWAMVILLVAVFIVFSVWKPHLSNLEHRRQKEQKWRGQTKKPEPVSYHRFLFITTVNVPPVIF